MRVPGRSTVRYNREPVPRVLGRALAVAAFLGVLGWLAVSLISGIPGRDYQAFSAVAPDPGNLIKFDPVRIGGVRVGQVQEIGTTPEGLTRLRLQINPGVKLPQDTKLRIRANSLLGARFVQLIPGRSRELLAEGMTLRGDASTLTYGVPDALDVFDSKTREALGPLTGELATGFLGQGRNVNDLLRVGAETVTPASRFLRAIDRPEANRRLLPSLSAMMQPLDANRRELTEMFGTTAGALQPFIDRREPFRDTLGEAPGALMAADTGLVAGSRLLAAARALGAQTLRTLPPAPAALDETTALLNEAREPVRRADSLLISAEQAIPPALRLTSSLRPLLRPATDLFDGLLPVAETLGPFGCDFKNFGAVIRSMTGTGNAQPGGTGGPAKQFRLTFADLNPASNLGVAGEGAYPRDAYPAACRYVSKPYPVVNPLGLLNPQELLNTGGKR